MDDRVGSIDVGKDADLVIWNGYPLSSYGVPEKVFIDGELFFDRTLPGYGLTHFAGAPDSLPAPPTSGDESEAGRCADERSSRASSPAFAVAVLFCR